MAKINEIQTSIQSRQMTPVAPVARLQQLLNRVDIKEKFASMLKDRAPAFMSSILSLANSTPQLQAADPMTIISSAAIAATLDLPINPTLGFAAIVPYKQTAQFQIMTKGLIQLAIRTGVYQTINATEIYEGEIVDYNRITGNFQIDESQRKSDKVIGYVAYFKLLSGFEKFLYMTVDQIRAHAKKFSKSYGNPYTPWTTNFEAMCMKTVLKLLLSKYGILSVEMRKQGETINEDRLQKAVEYDQAVVVQAETGEKVTYPDNPEHDPDAPGDAQEPEDQPTPIEPVKTTAAKAALNTPELPGIKK